MTNGTPEPSRILSMEAARANGIRKGNDFITVQQAYDMVIQECAKVHEHYLTQIPNFMARMIQDALLSYGLIALPASDISPAPVADAGGSSEPAGDVSGGEAVQGENGGLMVSE